MGSANQFDVVLTVEFFYDVAAEKVASASWTDHPANDVVGVAPHEITHSSIMRYFLLSVDHSDLIERANRR